jgi:hypothetical protein
LIAKRYLGNKEIIMKPRLYSFIVVIPVALLLHPSVCVKAQTASNKMAQSSIRGTILQALTEQADLSNTDNGLKLFTQTLVKVLTGAAPGDAYGDMLSYRLYMAQRMTLDGKKHLVSENDVAHAFNLMMARVVPKNGPSIKTTVEEVHSTRVFLSHVAPTLTSVQSHNSTCYPSEAVLLVHLLIGLHDPQPKGPHRPGTLVAYTARGGATYYLEHYLSKHSHFDQVKLFDSVTGAIGF